MLRLPFWIWSLAVLSALFFSAAPLMFGGFRFLSGCVHAHVFPLLFLSCPSLSLPQHISPPLPHPLFAGRIFLFFIYCLEPH